MKTNWVTLVKLFKNIRSTGAVRQLNRVMQMNHLGNESTPESTVKQIQIVHFLFSNMRSWPYRQTLKLQSKLFKKLSTNRVELTYTIWRIWTHLFSFRTWIGDLSDCAGSSYPSPQFSSLACGCIYSYFCERWELPWELLFGTYVQYVVKGCRSLNEWFVPTTPSFDCWFADSELMQCVLISWVSHWHSHTLIHTCGQFTSFS